MLDWAPRRAFLTAGVGLFVTPQHLFAGRSPLWWASAMAARVAQPVNRCGGIDAGALGCVLRGAPRQTRAPSPAHRRGWPAAGRRSPPGSGPGGPHTETRRLEQRAAKAAFLARFRRGGSRPRWSLPHAGRGNGWTEKRVCAFRNDHEIAVYREGE